MSPHHYIILYRNISNDFAEKLVLQNKRKTMRGEAFWGLKNPENPGASGGSAPWTPAGALPLDPTRALERAPGPHAVKTLRSLRSLRSTWTETIFSSAPRSNKSCTRPCKTWTFGKLGLNNQISYSFFLLEKKEAYQCRIVKDREMGCMYSDVRNHI